MPELIAPAEAYRESYCEALHELQDEWRHVGSCPERLPVHHDASGEIPRTTWWLVDGDEYIGTAWMRHVTPDRLLDAGGHIGYEIRPSKRGCGYGKLILKLMLEKAREAGDSSVVLLCNEDNPASMKIIEANGGVLVGERATDRKKGAVRHFVYLIEMSQQ